MTYPKDIDHRWPKGDHNRRLALAIDLVDFAAAAGISPEELETYEQTPTDGGFDKAVAEKVGAALERAENTRIPRVDNGPVPKDE